MSTSTIVPIEEYTQARRAGFATTSTTTIMATAYDDIRWVVPGYLPEGFSVLAGRQKLGKTWLALDWATAVATGGVAIGSIPVEQGDVLYLDFENGERRIQRRLKVIFRGCDLPDLSRLHWAKSSKELSPAFLDALDTWRLSVTSPRLVVIDVLQRIKPVGHASRNSYENDYSIWAPLQAWATRHGIGVVGIHHTRKGGADDPLEALSGSNGLSAVADTTLLLDRKDGGLTLYVRGRDVEERDISLHFADGLWAIRGDAAEIGASMTRRAISEALLEAGSELAIADIAASALTTQSNVRQTLVRMLKDGEVIRTARGRYIHPSLVRLTPPVTTVTTSQTPKTSADQGLRTKVTM
jgi:AAA domain